MASAFVSFVREELTVSRPSVGGESNFLILQGRGRKRWRRDGRYSQMKLGHGPSELLVA